MGLIPVTLAGRDRVADEKDDRDRRGCAFRSERRRGAAHCHDHVDLAADEIGGQCRKPIVAALDPAVFDRYVCPST